MWDVRRKMKDERIKDERMKDERMKDERMKDEKIGNIEVEDLSGFSPWSHYLDDGSRFLVLDSRLYILMSF